MQSTEKKNTKLSKAIDIAFIVFSLAVSSNSFAIENEEKPANVVYEKQTTFTCNKRQFKIPSYFPFGNKFVYNNKPPASNLYLNVQERECNPDYFNIVLGLSPDCSGENMCIESSFSYSKVGTNILENINGALLLNLKEVELDKNKNGYFVPSECHAYCSTAKLIWFDYDKQRIFIISTKNPQNTKEVIDELAKSANSYINNQE